MKPKYKKKLSKIADKLFRINQQAIRDNDEHAKSISCFLIERIEYHVKNDGETLEVKGETYH